MPNGAAFTSALTIPHVTSMIHEMGIASYNDNCVCHQRGQSHVSLSPDQGGLVLQSGLPIS